MRLDFDVENPSKYLYDLKGMIRNYCWDYLRSVVHFELHENIFLDDTAFQFQVSIILYRWHLMIWTAYP